MSCAETTVWNILEYYGNRYPEYRTINPSDILTSLSKMSFERILPSAGLRYTQVAALFKEFGFTPRTYFLKDASELKKALHYYVESGIPIGVAIEGLVNGERAGHSIVCIGHSDKKNINVNTYAYKNINFIDSSDFYNEYVLMDDNQSPYKIQDYNSFSVLNNPRVTGFVVPLYKRIFLEAIDARSIALNVLSHHEIGIDVTTLDFGNGHKYDPINNPIVIRLFLTSSRQYKHFKNLHANSEYISKVITHMSFPKFVWVAEISLKSLYLKNEVFGEIIIDATASRYTNIESLLFLHYPGYLGYRNSNESLTKIVDMLKLKHEGASGIYPLYINNLIGG